MNKRTITMGAIALSAITALGIGAQTVYAASYTTTQVASHNTASDCWEIIDGKVYNLTAFISAHPGGKSAITAQCGKDASAAFHNGPHGASAINAIASYQVGTLESTPAATTPAPTPTPAPTSTPTPTPAPASPAVSASTDASASVSTVSSKRDHHEDDDRDEREDEDQDEDEWEHHESLETEFEIEVHSSEHLFDDHGRDGRDHGEDD